MHVRTQAPLFLFVTTLELTLKDYPELINGLLVRMCFINVQFYKQLCKYLVLKYYSFSLFKCSLAVNFSDNLAFMNIHKSSCVLL